MGRLSRFRIKDVERRQLQYPVRCRNFQRPHLSEPPRRESLNLFFQYWGFSRDFAIPGNTG